MRLGFYYVLSVPYAAGFACFGGPVFGGFRLTGWIFTAMLAVAPIVFLLDRSPVRYQGWMWMPWVSIVVLSLMWVDTIGLKSIQDVCQIVTPFIIAPIASKALKTDRDLGALLRGFSHCAWILAGGIALRFLSDSAVLARPMAMTAAIVGCVFVARFREDPLLSLVGWGTCLLVSTLTGSRMATLAILLEWLVVPRFRRQALRIFAAVMIAGVAVALFYTPVFQQRFFFNEGGTLSDLKRGEFSDTGRFEAWSDLWSEVVRHPLIGSGANSSSAMVKQYWVGSDKPHNDYLRILLEQGSIGLTLFLVGVFGQVMSLRRLGFSGTGLGVEIRSAAFVGIMVFLVMAVTDNPIIYGVWFTHPLFVLLGASYSGPAVRRTSEDAEGGP